MSRGGRFADKSSAYEGNKMSHAYQKPIAIYNQTLGVAFNSMSGEPYSGVPRYYAPRFYTGNKIDMDSKEFNLLAFSYKSNVLSSYTASVESLRDTRYTTFVDLSTSTAKQHGITHGDRVVVRSSEGKVEGICRIREGLHPRSIGIEHGGGRMGEGGSSVHIDGITKEGRIARRSGVNINTLGLSDASRLNIATLSDFVIGSNARQAIPVRIEKV